MSDLSKISWLLILCFCIKVSSQTVLKSNEIDSTLSVLVEQRDFLKAAKVAHDYSIQLYRKRNYTDAIKYAVREVDIFEKADIINPDYTNALYNVGRFYYKNEQYNEVFPYYEKILTVESDQSVIGRAYCELGRSYRRTGDTFKSVAFYEKGIQLLTSQKENRSLYIQFINSAVALNEIKEERYLKKSLENLEKAKILFYTDSEARRGRKPYALFSGLANHYMNDLTYDFAKSKSYFEKILTESIKDKDSFAISAAYENLAELYLKDKRDSALFLSNQAIRFSSKNKTNILNSWRTKAKFHKSQSEFEKSLLDVQKGISFCLNMEYDTSIQPTKSELYGVYEKRNLLESFILKTEVLMQLGLGEDSKEYLTEVVQTVLTIDQLIGIMFNDSQEHNSKYRWLREASKAYLFGAYAAHLLNDSAQVFSFMEKSKALLLSEGVLKNTEFANLPRNISIRETSYQKRIYDLENELSKDVDNAYLKDSLFMAKQVHQEYIDSLKSIYPKYFARKVDVNQVSLEEVKKELNMNDAVVSFIWNDFDEEELLIGLLASKDDTQTFVVKNTLEVREKLEHYRKLISKPFETEKERTDFQTVAYEIFKLLFPEPELESLLIEKNLTIIPDGDLQNIPFESLIIKENSNNYLIFNGDINYAYSYSFLKHNDQVHRITDNDFIGYSPSSFDSLSLSSLVNSEEELLNINKELSGEIKLNNKATKEDFLKNSQRSKIIHLATHADIGQNPWIAFSDKKLELHELYTYRNSAELVTLSACNTTLGELAKGEGVLSLARGFFYSGSKSVVSSLWEVNDQSTQEIMSRFYKNLKEGQTKSAAINNAKRSYLNSHSLSEQSPYYWSSFILIGDAGAITLSSFSGLWMSILIAIIVLSIMVILLKRRSKS